jgi:type 1 glutamine amidotransferase
MLIGEDEYKTKLTLPEFARKFLYRDFRVSCVFSDPDDINAFPGIDLIDDADLLLVSVRRRTPPIEQLNVIRNFFAQGKPVVGIRTASHAFALRDGRTPPPGHDAWPEFDAEILGGNYQGHHGNKAGEDLKTYVWVSDNAESHPVVQGLELGQRITASWLYKTSPLKPGAHVLMMGRVGGRQPHEPVAWTYVHSGGGRAFYTSLGHPDDFQDPEFEQLLLRGIQWAVGQVGGRKPELNASFTRAFESTIR